MKIKIALIVLLLAVCLTASGCSYLKSTWKGTRKVYKEYVNPNPSLDLEVPEDSPRAEFSRLFRPVDTQLARLYRIMNSQDRFPSDEWYGRVLEELPWLSGLMAIDSSGVVLHQEPPVTMKSLDFTSELALGDEWNDRKVRGGFKETPLGPEFFLAAPFFKDSLWQGLIVAHFDPRSLCRLSDAPDRLILFSNSTLFCGRLGAEGPDKAMQLIENRLLNADKIQGTMDVDGRVYLWLARTMGGVWFIYAMEQ
ncbi:MAG: hypothetical protein EOM25_01375 [Deltaproteobacteria bacterium]|nr:hypothetical protein [Deltaproteobacteria bacterium]